MDYHFYMKLLRQLKIQENFVFTANMFSLLLASVRLPKPHYHFYF